MGETEEQFLQRVLNGIKRMDRLVGDVVAYSQVLSNEVQLVPINLEEVLQQVVDQNPQLWTRRQNDRAEA
jgi:signal transduction histidine kinase